MPTKRGPRYHYLSQTRSFLRGFAHVLRWSCFGLGIIFFLLHAGKLLTTGFGLGERVEIGLWALIDLGGFFLAGVLIHRLFLAGSELIELWLDEAEAQRETVRAIHEELVPAVERLTRALRASRAPDAVNAKPAILAKQSTAALRDQLRDAKEMGLPEQVLDIREALDDRLNETDRRELDEQLAEWFCKHFHTELQLGRAAEVADALERAVELLGDIPQMQHLRDALPTVRMSANLMAEIRSEGGR